MGGCGRGRGRGQTGWVLLNFGGAGKCMAPNYVHHKGGEVGVEVGKWSLVNV